MISCDYPILGVMQSCIDGIDVHDSYVYIKVDQKSQDMDYVGYTVPHTYTVTIGVHVAQADSRSGYTYVTLCR